MQIIGERDPNAISLYFHIPFCSKKCPYCHFFVLPNKKTFRSQFLLGLQQEWALKKHLLHGKKIVSIYLGGGTPSLLTVEEIASILNLPFQTGQVDPHAEITLEANPESLSATFASELASTPINRVSLGAQSFDEEELLSLGRTHTSCTTKEALHTLFQAGIHNLSIDLMYDLPHQTVQKFSKTLKAIQDLPLSHLSLYNLTIEPHTSFFKHRDQLKSTLPSSEESKNLLDLAMEQLPLMGFERYEISAFSKENRYSRHNVGYWIGRPFLGFGPSAFSHFQGKRFQNVPHLGKYLKALEDGVFPTSFEELLSPEKRALEFLAIHLRLVEGVSLLRFETLFGKDNLKAIEPTLQNLIAKGWLIQQKDQIFLSPLGLLFYDSVGAEII